MLGVVSFEWIGSEPVCSLPLVGEGWGGGVR